MKRWVVVGCAVLACVVGGAVCFGQERPEPGQGAPAAPVDTSPVVSEVELSAPLASVWGVFTTEEGFKKLGVAKAKIDLRVGGKIQSHYDPAGVLGDEGTIENTIIAFEPEHVFAFRISKPPKGFPFMNAYKDVWSVATMSDLGGGRTHLRLAMCGYTADEESQRMRRFFEQGNAWVMQKLKKNLEGEQAPKEGAEREVAREQADPLAPVECSEIIPAMQEEVWKCWTTPEGVESFLTDAKVELKIGGAYEFYFGKDAPEGQRGSEGCKVLSFEPMRMLSFSWNAPPKFAYARERRTWVVVYIEPYGPHSCRVTLRQMGFAEQAAASPEHAQEWKDVRAYFAAAWPRVLGELRGKYQEAPK